MQVNLSKSVHGGEAKIFKRRKFLLDWVVLCLLLAVPSRKIALFSRISLGKQNDYPYFTGGKPWKRNEMAQQMYQRKSVAKVEIKARLVRSWSNCVSVSSFFLYMILISAKYYPNLMEGTDKVKDRKRKRHD